MSGIYVKGMEMPKDGEHPYWVVIHSDGTVEYNENKGQGWQTSEAVPVPPHGALMDRDDFFATCPELVDGYKSITDGLVVIPAEEATP